MSGKRLFVATLAVSLCGLLATASWVDREGTRVEPLQFQPRTAVVVLGARVEASGLASKTLEARVMHGVAVMARAPADTVLVVSGGVGTYGRAEADVGADLAVMAGVPRARVLRETKSHSTHENALESAEVLDALGIGQVVLVSDPYHLPRARAEFERLGFTVQTSPVLEAPRHEDGLARVWWTVREVAALARLQLRG